ncbi:LuxR C-terminal-related transcriptional regulator [Geodermatophilus sp. SYSU D01106]|uniref:helix-turn-helix transcriptional regulator n=1 Tax=Geodermatophilus sp. FMUSA9-8 TaxID=3120155 RepID=UPI00300AD11F
MSLPATARPDDRDVLRAAVREVHARSGMGVVFAGPVQGAAMRIEEMVGGRTRYLHGLQVRTGAGLGGRVLSEGRPAGVEDYERALDITHEYDGPVLAEGLRTVAAVPVLVDGRARAVLYAASREGGSVGDRVRDALARAAGRMGAELAVRDEVDRRVALMAAAPAGPSAAEDPARWEEVRAVHADLRLAAQATDDAALRDRLLSACGRLAALGAPRGTRPAVRLSAREVDVLTQVALGCSNRETATRLSLRPETVKSYLGSAMTKLDAHTRLEAVVQARRLGLLP